MTIYCQRRNRRGHLLATKLAIQVQLKVLYMQVRIWKSQQSPTVFLHDVKNLDSVETLRTLLRHHQQAYLHPESFAILQALSDCFVWRFSVPSRCKQFSRAQAAVESTKVTCSWSTQPLNGIKDHASVSWVQLTDHATHWCGYSNDIIAENDVETREPR